MRVSGDNSTGSFTQGLSGSSTLGSSLLLQGELYDGREGESHPHNRPFQSHLASGGFHDTIGFAIPELANSPFFVYRPDGHYQSQRAGQKP